MFERYTLHGEYQPNGNPIGKFKPNEETQQGYKLQRLTYSNEKLWHSCQAHS